MSKVEVVVLGSPSLISLVVSVDVTELRSCVKVDVAVPRLVLKPDGFCGLDVKLHRN